MEKVLIDSDVIVDFLRGYQKRIKTIFRKIEQGEIKALVSSVSIVELYAGKDSEIEEKELILVKLISFFEIIPINYPLGIVAGKLKRKYRLGLADSIIAATALENKAKLFTFNIKHFTNLAGLNLYS